MVVVIESFTVVIRQTSSSILYGIKSQLVVYYLFPFLFNKNSNYFTRKKDQSMKYDKLNWRGGSSKHSKGSKKQGVDIIERRECRNSVWNEILPSFEGLQNVFSNVLFNMYLVKSNPHMPHSHLNSLTSSLNVSNLLFNLVLSI